MTLREVAPQEYPLRARLDAAFRELRIRPAAIGLRKRYRRRTDEKDKNRLQRLSRSFLSSAARAGLMRCAPSTSGSERSASVQYRAR